MGRYCLQIGLLQGSAANRECSELTSVASKIRGTSVAYQTRDMKHGMSFG